MVWEAFPGDLTSLHKEPFFSGRGSAGGSSEDPLVTVQLSSVNGLRKADIFALTTDRNLTGNNNGKEAKDKKKTTVGLR